MSDVWKQTLSELRSRFMNAGQKYPDLCCAIAQVKGHDNYATAERLLEIARWISFLGAETWGRGGSMVLKPGRYENLDAERRRVIEPPTECYYRFYGNRSGAAAFMQIAVDAGWCLPDQAHPQIQDLPQQNRSSCSPFRWLLFLFQMAWLCPTGRTLRAVRSTDSCPPDSEPDWNTFISALPVSPFQASVEAIDILVSEPTHVRTQTEGGNEGQPTDPTAPNGEIAPTPPTRAELLRQLEPTVHLAYLAFTFAESQAGKRLQDREAFDLIRDKGIPTDKGDLGVLADYELPAFDTWTRYLRAARNVLGEQKNTPRHGRSHSKSIARQGEIEQLEQET